VRGIPIAPQPWLSAKQHPYRPQSEAFWPELARSRTKTEKTAMSTLPHFVIAGAPKCGTTSLYYYLQEHPSIFMPANKEPRFFCNYSLDQFEFGKKHFHPNIVTDPDSYLSLFDNAPQGAICGEASTDYLSRSGTAARIHDWNPHTKIIIMLRNPVDRAYSEYRHSIKAGLQTETFWNSLRLENARVAGGYDPIFWHVRRGLYSSAVEDFIDTLGRDNVRIILFDEFSADTARIVMSIFEFLGVPQIDVDTSTRHAADDRTPHNRAGISSFIKRTPNQSRRQNFARYVAGDLDPVRMALTPEQYSSLKGCFSQDIEHLQAILQRDLSHWLKDNLMDDLRYRLSHALFKELA
jgi:Sulfotransferase domain